MSVDNSTVETLPERYDHAVVSFLRPDGYPVNVATPFRVIDGTVVLDPWAEPQPSDQVEVTFSHIRPQPGVGYDERRYVDLWGRLRRTDRGLELVAERSFGWDEQDVPFFRYSEETVPQAHRYLRDLSRRLGRAVRPRLSFGWLALRATRLPFVTATIVPVLLGIAVAALDGTFRPAFAGLTLVAALCIHLGLNVANDVFDTLSGADDANPTPTPYSGGSRVIRYGLVKLRTMALVSAGFYAAGIGLGLYLAWRTQFWPLFWLGVAGVVISVAYTAPPLRLVHRGVGEFAVAAGFGPIVTLGAAFVQLERFPFEALYASLPVAILIALVLYVNEIPDRTGDAAAGKRTLPVRLAKGTVVGAYAVAAGLAYALIAGGAVAGILPFPTIIALATIPMAVDVHRGLVRHYDSPYELMAAMGKNIGLHLVCGLLLVAGYGVAIAADRLLDAPPFFLS